MTMKNLFAFFLVIVAVMGMFGSLVYFFWQRDTGVGGVLTINDATIRIVRAATPAERAQGLSGKDALSENEGMLFVFDRADYHAFWMKDMRFPLDIIWIDDNRVVVDMATHALPSSFPASFVPVEPARYVLEVSAGFADRHKIRVGDRVEF